MKEYEIHLNDWGRIIAGQVPGWFYFELIFRAAFVFLLLLVCMRILGRRMAAQLSRNEMAALVSLAAAGGVPILAQDRGLLPAVVIALVVIGISKLTSKWAFDNSKVEKATIGDVSILVEDGVMKMKELERTKISRERLFSQLRTEELIHLGEVKRLYMEATGEFSFIREENAKPGLLLLPSNDDAFVKQKALYMNKQICLKCGLQPEEQVIDDTTTCKNCGSHKFTEAVIAV
jgi:uncharacterized membrane protein YcaP (DUF421 family)